MVSKSSFERRNCLSYLALYYAIQGDEERSEQIRSLVRKLEEGAAMDDAAQPVTA